MELELVSKSEQDTPGTDSALDGDMPKYVGPERRKSLRRITVDRREMIRFESKSDRRTKGDRRGEQKLWDGRNF
ncbi:MAG: hypothetical protein COB30_016250 [Ectothiorhodospiraceae bacterium]|nr:hypothetical protein [Ectothiorhodospiraceae bacterium]